MPYAPIPFLVPIDFGRRRCARNCFLCPNCKNTLAVVPSDPIDSSDSRLTSIPVNVVGEAPFVLYCNHCRWDSLEVGIKFDKPTGLAGHSIFTFVLPRLTVYSNPAQLQKDEDMAVDSVEFDALKEHFEPAFRASASSSHGASSSALHTHGHAHKSSITAAASAALARDIPGVAKYNPSRSTRGGGRDKGPGNKDEIPRYKTRLKCADGKGSRAGDADVEWIKRIETIEEVATLEQRSSSSWSISLRTECVPVPATCR